MGSVGRNVVSDDQVCWGMRNSRILIVDDHRSIHSDFRKILSVKRNVEEQVELNDMADFLFGEDASGVKAAITPQIEYRLDSAFQGRQALEMVKRAAGESRPYAVVFLDINMPPGWDGVETARRIRQACPDLEIVLVSAYADYRWEDVKKELGESPNLLFLRKPFDASTVKQLAASLTMKWSKENQPHDV